MTFIYIYTYLLNEFFLSITYQLSNTIRMDKWVKWYHRQLYSFNLLKRMKEKDWTIRRF
jgi:hypothetical protein